MTTKKHMTLTFSSQRPVKTDKSLRTFVTGQVGAQYVLYDAFPMGSRSANFLGRDSGPRLAWLQTVHSIWLSAVTVGFFSWLSPLLYFRFSCNFAQSISLLLDYAFAMWCNVLTLCSRKLECHVNAYEDFTVCSHVRFPWQLSTVVWLWLILVNIFVCVWNARLWEV